MRGNVVHTMVPPWENDMVALEPFHPGRQVVVGVRPLVKLVGECYKHVDRHGIAECEVPPVHKVRLCQNVIHRQDK